MCRSITWTDVTFGRSTSPPEGQRRQKKRRKFIANGPLPPAEANNPIDALPFIGCTCRCIPRPQVQASSTAAAVVVVVVVAVAFYWTSPLSTADIEVPGTSMVTAVVLSSHLEPSANLEHSAAVLASKKSSADHSI